MSQPEKGKPINRMPTGDLWPAKTVAPRQATNTDMFRELDADLFLANQLFRHGLSSQVLDGVTVSAQRRERIRREILAADLDQALVLGAKPGSAPETLAQAFERRYHEPLI